MQKNVKNFEAQLFNEAVNAELSYIRQLGSNDNLILASANLGAYEALLIILSGGEAGVPVYQAVTSVRSRFSSQAGIISRIRLMRQAGLLVEKPGVKKSQVCLAPSEQLLQKLEPILRNKYYGDVG